jgi:hypothetical protein
MKIKWHILKVIDMGDVTKYYVTYGELGYGITYPELIRVLKKTGRSIALIDAYRGEMIAEIVTNHDMRLYEVINLIGEIANGEVQSDEPIAFINGKYYYCSDLALE